VGGMLVLLFTEEHSYLLYVTHSNQGSNFGKMRNQYSVDMLNSNTHCN